LIKDILKRFKNNIKDSKIDLNMIFFEFTDLDEIYNLNACEVIDYPIEDKRFLKFKISTESLFEIIEGNKHPEDLLFDEKVKISGDISILSE
tara:strand:- start:93 stop:368 length:276 start_codon:yes stop_codon:yes gene_type:complete